LLAGYLSLSVSIFKSLFYELGETNKESGMLKFVGYFKEFHLYILYILNIINLSDFDIIFLNKNFLHLYPFIIDYLVYLKTCLFCSFLQEFCYNSKIIYNKVKKSPIRRKTKKKK
jgi:hypothetical protein